MCRNGSHTVKSPMQSPNGSASNALPHSASSTRKPQHANPDTSLRESHYQRARHVILSYVDEENKIVSPQIVTSQPVGSGLHDEILAETGVERLRSALSSLLICRGLLLREQVL